MLSLKKYSFSIEMSNDIPKSSSGWRLSTQQQANTRQIPSLKSDPPHQGECNQAPNAIQMMLHESRRSSQAWPKFDAIVSSGHTVSKAHPKQTSVYFAESPKIRITARIMNSVNETAHYHSLWPTNDEDITAMWSKRANSIEWVGLLKRSATSPKRSPRHPLSEKATKQNKANHSLGARRRESPLVNL